MLSEYSQGYGLQGATKKLFDSREVSDQFNPANRIKVHLATGGLVPGADQRRDTVPAMLRGGEFVTVPEAVKSQGVGRFHALNAGRAAIMLESELQAIRQGYASGGYVGDGGSQTIIPSAPGRVVPRVTAPAGGGGNKPWHMPAEMLAVMGAIQDHLERLEPADAGAFYALGAKKRPGVAMADVRRAFHERSDDAIKTRKLIQGYN